MDKINRRGFFRALNPSKGSTESPSGAKREPSVAKPEAEPSSGFSLAAFYAARSPQKLPTIAIHPSVLHHVSQPSRVGLAPPHQSPDLSDDPVYLALSAALQLPAQSVQATVDPEGETALALDDPRAAG
jgi:hypothetical protein